MTELWRNCGDLRLIGTAMHWIGLDWIGLDCIGLDWIGLDWIGLRVRFATHRNSLVENSVELIDMPSYNNRGKNSSDIKLVVDALELAITRSHVDTFVIVSGCVHTSNSQSTAGGGCFTTDCATTVTVTLHH
jgi:hypothetical protein